METTGLREAAELPCCKNHTTTDWACQVCISTVDAMRLSERHMREHRANAIRLLNGESEESIWPHRKYLSFSPAYRCLTACTEAYLTTHPSEEPITLKTWVDLFGDKTEIKSAIGSRLTFSGVNGVGGTSCVWLNGEILWVASHPESYMTTIPQLRHLLAALGCGVQQTTEGA